MFTLLYCELMKFDHIFCLSFAAAPQIPPPQQQKAPAPPPPSGPRYVAVYMTTLLLMMMRCPSKKVRTPPPPPISSLSLSPFLPIPLIFHVLLLVSGDAIIDVTVIDEGWMEGRVQRTGAYGMLPSNYVKKQ